MLEHPDRTDDVSIERLLYFLEAGGEEREEGGKKRRSLAYHRS